MNLSLEKLVPNGETLPERFHIDLIEEKMEAVGGALSEFNLDTWPILVFLKGTGFSRIEFRTNDEAIIDRWINRIQQYEQKFIQDPENLHFDECLWDELSPESEEPLIHCVRLEIQKAPQKLRKRKHHVPPMEAHLGVDARSVERFVDEIRQLSPKDTLLRTQFILQEFKQSKKDVEGIQWAQLIGDIISVSLEAKHLDKAIHIAEENRTLLRSLWSDSQRVVRIFSAYEPKSQELKTWSKIFDTLPLEDLVRYLESHLSSSAGPQIVRLMNERAPKHTEQLFAICIRENASMQKLILQWLSPHWQTQHYRDLLKCLFQSLKRGDDLELVNHWINGLLRSYPSLALQDLKSFFEPPKFLAKLFKKDKQITPHSQKSVLVALGEHRSTEVLQFLKDIKPWTQGEAADEIERQIHTYRGKVR